MRTRLARGAERFIPHAPNGSSVQTDAWESVRLHQTPRGVLERLRTWDLLERWLPAGGVVYDVGGGAGVHAAWLADRDYDVELVETSERRQALIEARRLLRPGGLLIAAGISRFAWLMDAYRKEIADSEEVQAGITYTLRTGRSNADPKPGAFWAYFHRPDELTDEMSAAGFGNVSGAGVEGFAWMLPDLGAILDSATSAEALMGQLRTIESESSVVGASGHLLARGMKPGSAGTGR